ncbi:hypothetical protein ACLH6Q_001766 [Campylobacter fetus]|nr:MULTISPECIES: hypothetical protein [Campylobacter]EDO9691648.1 hypothetical protein [Campylobacter fetus]EGL1353961.1 hypothetical protein [Campylobacter fetus]EKJ0130230.1 hypothetical protein [Campylobacter fetus]EKJ0131919.1 hypothetical protein [Campylobacter fetus]EKJ0568390.1 hypothetical protein [Campylobacter fetus]
MIVPLDILTEFSVELPFSDLPPYILLVTVPPDIVTEFLDTVVPYPP